MKFPDLKQYLKIFAIGFIDRILGQYYNLICEQVFECWDNLYKTIPIRYDIICCDHNQKEGI